MAEATPEAEFIAVDVDENDQAAAKAGVTCMPTFQFWKNGKQIEEDKLEGANEVKLKERLAKHN